MDMNSFEARVIERLTSIESKLESLTGNGQPGEIQRMRDDIEDLKAAHNRGQGIRTAVSAGIGVAGGLLGALAGAWRK
jgi:hypothetical protein